MDMYAKGTALGVAEGVPFRFTSFYAQEVIQDHIIMLEFQDVNSIDTGVPCHLPNQGLGMYTFYTRSIADVLAKTKKEETEILSQITTLNDPYLDKEKLSC